MTQINLLPWREQARKAKMIRFAIMLGLSFGLTLILVLFTHLTFDSFIDSQNQDNDFLQTQLANEHKNLALLDAEKKLQIAIANQVNYIFSLREKSYKAVHLFDVLPRIVPDAVLLMKMTRAGDQVSLIGKAESNLQVTLLMDNMSRTRLFNQPVLSEISEGRDEDAASTGKYFQIVATQQE